MSKDRKLSPYLKDTFEKEIGNVEVRGKKDLSVNVVEYHPIHH